MTSKAQAAPFYSYIDTQAALGDLIEHITKSPMVAIDTEADSYHHYFEKVCLIQLTLDGQNYIVDPLSDIDLSQFLNLLSQKQLIIHDAGYDLRIMRSSFAFRPHNVIFDTMAAAQLLGYEQFSLVALLKRFFEVDLSKKGQRSDWSKRPLKKTQLEYAVDDTRFLSPLAEILKSELIKCNRLDWHQQSCENVMRSALLEKNEQDPDKIWRVKDTSRLSGEQLRFVKALWFWRDQQARENDLPAFRIMGNEKILNLALWAQKNPHAPIENSPDLPRTCKGPRLKTLKNTIQKAQNTPREHWPESPKRFCNHKYLPNCKELIDALRAERVKIAYKLGIAPQTLASTATLANIAYKRPENIEKMIEVGPMMPWQAQILEPTAQKLLNQFPPPKQHGNKNKQTF
jgi:ribonuclease D